MDLEDLNEAINSNISRLVAFLTPTITAAVAAGLVWLQNALGVDMQQHAATIAGFVVAIVLGGCLTAAKWLEGRAEFETAAAAALALVPGGVGGPAVEPSAGED